jgi:hypothetical protein
MTDAEGRGGGQSGKTTQSAVKQMPRNVVSKICNSTDETPIDGRKISEHQKIEPRYLGRSVLKDRFSALLTVKLVNPRSALPFKAKAPFF